MPGHNALVLQTGNPEAFLELYGSLHSKHRVRRALCRAGRATAKHHSWPSVIRTTWCERPGPRPRARDTRHATRVGVQGWRHRADRCRSVRADPQDLGYGEVMNPVLRGGFGLWLAIQLVACDNSRQPGGTSDDPSGLRSQLDHGAGQGAGMGAHLEVGQAGQASAALPSRPEDAVADPPWPDGAQPPTCPSGRPRGDGEHGLWTFETCYAACGFVVTDPGDGSVAAEGFAHSKPIGVRATRCAASAVGNRVYRSPTRSRASVHPYPIRADDDPNGRGCGHRLAGQRGAGSLAQYAHRSAA